MYKSKENHVNTYPICGEQHKVHQSVKTDLPQHHPLLDGFELPGPCQIKHGLTLATCCYIIEAGKTLITSGLKRKYGVCNKVQNRVKPPQMATQQWPDFFFLSGWSIMPFYFNFSNSTGHLQCKGISSAKITSPQYLVNHLLING